MAHGASTEDDCPVAGCGGWIVGYWSEHQREDGTWCDFGPDHPDWADWIESQQKCHVCGEPGGDDLEDIGAGELFVHTACDPVCPICGERQSDRDEDWLEDGRDGEGCHQACAETPADQAVVSG